ncbi:uncharacterized protein V1510DRAFT_411437 [Dipodascopsis tothii]|uniref:uncharacterized protein n=1 Tax=Dipodascopsis tothii TaxID=44089 RepID=UPI0034CE571F
MAEKDALLAGSNAKSYAAVPTTTGSSSDDEWRTYGELPGNGFYGAFLRIDDARQEGKLIHFESSPWQLHFAAPFYHSMICDLGACDGRDFGANERNYLAWLRLAAAFVSTATAFILNFYLPPGTPIFGPAGVETQPALQNRASLAFGLLFLLSALGCFLYAYFCYVEHMAIVGRRWLLLQFNWHSLFFSAGTYVLVIAACAVYLAASIISPV